MPFPKPITDFNGPLTVIFFPLFFHWQKADDDHVCKTLQVLVFTPLVVVLDVFLPRQRRDRAAKTHVLICYEFHLLCQAPIFHSFANY